MTRFEKWSVLSTSLATAATGTGYFGVKYLMEPSEPWAVVNHPLQPWLLKLHILVAPLLVFAVGMIAVRHVWQHFRRGVRPGRRSGIASAAVFAPMVVTGYLIQSVTAEAWLQGVAWAHIGASLVFSVGVAVHAVVAARRKQALPLLSGTSPQAESPFPRHGRPTLPDGAASSRGLECSPRAGQGVLPASGPES